MSQKMEICGREKIAGSYIHSLNHSRVTTFLLVLIFHPIHQTPQGSLRVPQQCLWSHLIVEVMLCLFHVQFNASPKILLFFHFL